MPEPVPSPMLCPDCGAQVTPAMIVCPGCRRLLHAETLKRIAAEAERAEAEKDPSTASARWREALGLLPPESRQHAAISERIARLGREIDASGARPSAPSGALGKKLAGLGALGLLLWKFKLVVVFALTKGKLLLLGLTKASTVFSMLLAFGVYWSAWGWKFAAGLIAGIYVHEMGHVAALRRYGISASMPMFIPGFGALVRLKQAPASVAEDARVGLAGPMWGLGATAAAWAIAAATGWKSFLAIAHVSAWINLFNLLPLGPLDGGRGFRALTKKQRLWAAAAIAAAWALTAESLFLLLLIAAGLRLFGSDAPKEEDRGALWTYAAILAGLSLMLWLAGPAAQG